ncbi:MAG: UDP-glucose 4-epimerase GalE [Hyphomonadaceae bacterium]|nr:UDP-glucose 4-epimerase GalE [Hyphomonadaceae bacterium]GIK47413.1 MAG: UDP-glucose 4-epimerase GalE [Alphaproteobacteria bacterium]
MATILVTGGAGYVGSHCCLALKRAGHDVVVYDNLFNGHERFVKWGPFERGDIRDKARLAEVFARHKPAAVIHCAALIEVGESVKFPDRFYDNNVAGALALLDVMREAGVGPFVFSSTCATYGEPLRLPMDETHPQNPVSPYGWTKLMIERASRDIAAAYGMSFAHLRYFNAAGAAPEEGVGERHEPETHAIPLALMTLLGRRDGFKIFGQDWDTRDGSCLRDYIHVLDLADAHVRAVERLMSGGESLAANLGVGDGVTVIELLAAIERVTGKRVPASPAPRRAGDAPALVANNAYARRELGWTPARDIDAIIADAWKWHCEVEPKLFS